MVSFIQNISLKDMQMGNHFDVGTNSILIQILDPRTDDGYLTDLVGNLPSWVPNPKHQFSQRHVFQFLDIEDDNEYVEEAGITRDQARILVGILQRALSNNMHIIVHCTRGVCRSGAVVEVAEMLGFMQCKNFRIPNARVKRLMVRELEWSYEE